ncbi:hypothetical protein FRC00_000701 [Tulasnella sp. 408]|nr:hypothetical protein FRC00_000701 [Tulasnella sp. 408]
MSIATHALMVGHTVAVDAGLNSLFHAQRSLETITTPPPFVRLPHQPQPNAIAASPSRSTDSPSRPTAANLSSRENAP